MSVFEVLIVGTAKILGSHKNQICSKHFTNSTVSKLSSAFCQLYLTLRIQGFD